MIIILKSLPAKAAFGQCSAGPLPELIRSARTLEMAGADFIIMPCHTAHIWFNEVKKAVQIPFYSIIQNTVQMITQQQRNRNSELLLLATETLVNCQLYQHEFKNSPFTIILPTAVEQKVVDQAIKDVKAGKLASSHDIKVLNRILTNYAYKGVSLLIGCCTEIPLMFPFFNVKMKMIDPTLMLAKLAIKKALTVGG